MDAERLRLEVGEAQTRADEVREQLRTADVVTDELRTQAEEAIAGLERAKTDLALAERLARDADEARAASTISAGGPQHDERTGDTEARRALGEAVSAALQQRSPSQECVDVFTRYGLDSTRDAIGHLVLPDELIRDAQRAATTMSSAAHHSPLTGGQVFGHVRPQNASDMLGIQMSGVLAGQPKAAWVSTSPDGAAQAEDASLPAINPDEAQLAEVELEPRRVVSERGVTVEADAGLEVLATVVTQDAYSAVRAAVEAQLMNGNGTAPNLTGVNGRAESSGRTVPAAVDTFAGAITAFESLLDGTYASTTGDLRIVVSADLHAYLASLRASDQSTESVASYLARMCGGYMVSAYAPSDVTGGTGTVNRALVRRGNHAGASFVPSWGMRLVTDTTSPAGTKFAAVQVMNAFYPQTAAAQGGRGDWKLVSIRSAA